LLKTNKRDKKGIKKRIAAIDGLLFLQLEKDKSIENIFLRPIADLIASIITYHNQVNQL